MVSARLPEGKGAARAGALSPGARGSARHVGSGGNPPFGEDVSLYWLARLTSILAAGLWMYANGFFVRPPDAEAAAFRLTAQKFLHDLDRGGFRV